MDRRPVFFAAVAVAVALLIPITEPEHRWVPLGLLGIYLLLATAGWIERRSRARLVPQEVRHHSPLLERHLPER